ncbi:MAG: hypothetical protein E7Z77_05260 [Methanobrevibacter sp.]|uniref:hypothetical protein n=1 Tax=Methanobrevibacter sp. TaxID=66852 RepID=UPI0025DFACB0|nr:hypothetical protein [Methanobrevibacter sp.]MBE6508808.1 hypothetical protein [Methanobrevibacter sp.]
MSKFEPTLLPFNKNDDNVKIAYEKINLNKSLVDDLCKDNDLDSNLLILAATCITLTKYVNTTEIFIRVDDVPLIFDDDDRDKVVFDYINDVRKCLDQSNDVDEESFFNIVFGDYDDRDAEDITLFVCEDSLRLKYDSNKYT